MPWCLVNRNWTFDTYDTTRCCDVWLTETECSTPTTPHTMPWRLINRNRTFDTYDTTYIDLTIFLQTADLCLGDGLLESVMNVLHLGHGQAKIASLWILSNTSTIPPFSTIYFSVYSTLNDSVKKASGWMAKSAIGSEPPATISFTLWTSILLWGCD